MNLWNSLPNAAHIDQLIASVGLHPEVWTAATRATAWYETRAAAGDAAWSAVGCASRTAVWDAAWAAAGVDGEAAAWDAAGDAILALVAYDDCARYLDMTGDELAVWARLTEDPAAVLLVPAVIALEKIKELEQA